MSGGHTSNAVLMLILLSRYNIVKTDYAATHQFEISTDISGNEIDITWTFNETISIYGFKPMIYSSSDRTILYESPMLHHSERYMKIGHELDGTNDICVHVYKNSTQILSERCEEVKVSDYKAVIGILAGTIFLIPCIVGLSYVIYQDYRKRNDVHYTKLQTKATHKKCEDIPTSAAKTDELILKVTIEEPKKHNINGSENAAFMTDGSEYKLTDEKVEIGTEAAEDRQDDRQLATVNGKVTTIRDINVDTDKVIAQSERL